MIDEAPDAATEVELSCGTVAVARYCVAPDLPAAVSPRPHLHPVRTLAGTAVTESGPADHPHHLGAGVAIADLGTGNFWGGRTWMPGRGPCWLANHGRQRHLEWLTRSPHRLAQELSWEHAHGAQVLRERRCMTVRVMGDGCWALDFRFTLVNVTTGPVAIASPAVSGRAGAGYGGFFWRAPASSAPVRAFSSDGRGARAVHGRPAPWVALAGTASSGAWTLVFVAGDPLSHRDPWFVRTAGYPGVGSSLAWHRPLLLAPGDTVDRRIVTVVADGARDQAQAAALAAAAC